MKNFLKIILLFSLLTSVSYAYISNQQTNMLRFQVVQSDIVFNKTTVDSATIQYPKTSADSYGVSVKLNEVATHALSKMTEEGLGKKVNIILNGKVISSAILLDKLGDSFLVTGLTKEDAESFIESLQ